MANDTLERWATEETEVQPVVYEATEVDSTPDQDLACAKCVGECKIY